MEGVISKKVDTFTLRHGDPENPYLAKRFEIVLVTSVTAKKVIKKLLRVPAKMLMNVLLVSMQNAMKMQNV